MSTTIPLLAGYTDGTIQWRAETLQLANWGGFDGYHPIDLSPVSTLIAGATGSGKSTLLDAYTALMMPHNVAFNSASNQAPGRARGADQRTLLTYLRGKLDDASSDAVLGGVTDKVLRGQDSAVWGGIAMTFLSDDEQRLTALRVYVAPRGASNASDVVMRMFTMNGKPQLDEFDGLQDGNFHATAVKGRFPGIEPHRDYARFSQVLFTRLGIGAGGDGEKALKLLAKIQGGQPVRTVDGLFKEMVLEVPVTYGRADDALHHFEHLDKAYRDLEEDAEKERTLAPIAGLYGEYQRACEQVEQLDRFGVSRSDDAPFDLWRVRSEAELVDRAADKNREERRAMEVDRMQADVRVSTCQEHLQQAQRQLRDSGGDRLETLNARLEREDAEAHQTATRRALFQDRIRQLDVIPSTREIHAELAGAAGPFIAAFEDAQQRLSEHQGDLHADVRDQRALVNELKAEQESLMQRAGLVPREHDYARRAIAEACGLHPDDLPFAAELMDVAPEHERWRLAAEVTLRGVGLTMLMDDRKQAMIRQRIDRLHLNRRIQFDGVDLSDKRAEPPDPGYISGRLVFKTDSPFTRWVQRRVYAEDHLCVDSPNELGGDERIGKVTIHGQTSRGKRGAHGRNPNQRNILGFSNEARRQEIEDETQTAVRKLGELVAAQEESAREVRRHQAKHEAYRYILDHPWEEIDVQGAQARVQATRAELDSLRAASNVLAQLEKVVKRATDEMERAVGDRERLKDRHQRLNREHGELVELQDELQDEQAALSRVVELPDEDERTLTVRFSEFWGEDVAGDRGHSTFRSETRRFRRSMRTETDQQRQIADSKSQTLTRIFESYHGRWPDNNRGTGVDSYLLYAEIYDHITRHGLFERKETFKRSVNIWAGQDLVTLNDSFEVAINHIEERLDPVNEILAGVPFGPREDRLRIVLRRLTPQRLVTFRQELRWLASNALADLTDEQAEERFKRLRGLMNQLLKATSADEASYRDEVLDVRRHIEITARSVHPATGEEISIFSSLGGKSGGESQELVAFIVGAALRFQLGDETRTRPRFAPVMLDEGFVKADGEFAHRAVQAWRQLGFQLILAVPLDKVTALEPHVDLRLCVAKGPSGLSQVYSLVETE
jgi:uncharacterized protein YPO0396